MELKWLWLYLNGASEFVCVNIDILNWTDREDTVLWLLFIICSISPNIVFS